MRGFADSHACPSEDLDVPDKPFLRSFGRSLVRLALMQRPHSVPSSSGLKGDSFRTGGSVLETKRRPILTLLRIHRIVRQYAIQCSVKRGLTALDRHFIPGLQGAAARSTLREPGLSVLVGKSLSARLVL